MATPAIEKIKKNMRFWGDQEVFEKCMTICGNRRAIMGIPVPPEEKSCIKSPCSVGCPLKVDDEIVEALTKSKHLPLKIKMS